MYSFVNSGHLVFLNIHGHWGHVVAIISHRERFHDMFARHLNEADLLVFTDGRRTATFSTTGDLNITFDDLQSVNSARFIPSIG